MTTILRRDSAHVVKSHVAISRGNGFKNYFLSVTRTIDVANIEKNPEK
jgi:hypothetical protein